MASIVGCFVATPELPPLEPIEVESGGVAMVLVPGGSFSMGDGSGDAAPVHEVELTGFAIDKYETRQSQLAELEIPDASHFKDPDRPVEMIRWSEAAMFCNARSRAEGLTPCYDEETFECDFAADGYRLPTEAEWEYAARSAGRDRPMPGGGATSSSELARVACYGGGSGGRTEPVGSRRPNALGLHDMLGNVAEWCHDRYAADYYAQSPAEDPRGPGEGKKRVLRGGSWKSGAAECRTTARRSDEPGIHDACFARDTYGFRCARRLTAEEARRLK